MGYGIVMVVAAIVAQQPRPKAQLEKAKAQKPRPAAKADAPAAEAELKEARRLLNNGRYAEAEEAFAAVRAAASKQPGRLTPALKLALALGLAECQSSQGEYAKAIEILKAAEADDPKSAEPAGPALRPVPHPRRLGCRRGRDEAGREDRPRQPAGPLDRGAAAGPPRRDGQGGRRLQVVHRPLQRPASRDPPRRRCPAPGRPGRRALLPRHGARRGAERVAQRRDQRDLRGGAARPIPTAGGRPGSRGGCSSPATTRRPRRASWRGPSRSTRSRPRSW